MVAAVALAGVLGACTGDGDAPGTVAARCDPRLDAAFRTWARAGFSGSIAISTGGRSVCLAAYGSANDADGTPNTVDTVFAIGSVTKAFTAAAVLELVEDGRLALDDRAGDLLPELTGPAAEVTVRRLLLHTSGLSGSHGEDHRPLDRAAALAAISGLESAFRPGSGYAYSNAGYTLLALIIEKASGTTYRRYTASRTLRLPDGRIAGGFWDGRPAPTGPRAVGHLDGGRPGARGDFAGPHWALDGNGGLAMTAGDLAAWTYALFTGRVVSAESVETLTRPGYDHGKGRSETPGWVAHDASVHGTPFLTTAGGGGDVGHDVVVAWVPEGRRVIVMASNKPKVSAESLLAKVGPALLAGKPLPTPHVPNGAGAGARPGKYGSKAGGTFDVTATGHRITVTATGIDTVTALFPPSGGVSAADFRANEQRVLALLNGRTEEGRKERATLERDFGPLRRVALAGTLFRDGDVRTYVTLMAGTKTIIGWYSLDAEGGVGAAEVPAAPPALTLVPDGAGRYRPDDPTGTGPAVTVEFRNGRMTLTGPGGTTVAEPAG
ncbi:CubicO group peptidase (beta-lactamase class C family) [Thermomonospora umbrina]|uniref:CubicO group peptidase (Beta-lactamase class C family) n=2 Tax=Thermomonospora umbrina TaxID=111806 RepID=A0A3D9SLN0_9ACTN|nr:CubicO group peptidase (beta-lactamase class C family) [Thermomonospora umbrina]